MMDQQDLRFLKKDKSESDEDDAVPWWAEQGICDGDCSDNSDKLGGGEKSKKGSKKDSKKKGSKKSLVDERWVGNKNGSKDKCDESKYHPHCIYSDNDPRLAGKEKSNKGSKGSKGTKGSKEKKSKKDKKTKSDKCDHSHYHKGCVYEEGDPRIPVDSEKSKSISKVSS